MLLALMCASRASAGDPPLRTLVDVRVDHLSRHALLTTPPRELVDPGRQIAARFIADVRQGLFFGGALAQIWAFAWFWRSGRAAQTRDALRRRFRSRVAVRAGFGAVLGAIAPLARLPFFFASYRLGFNVGLTEQHVGSWLLDFAAQTAVDAALAAAGVAIVLELVDRTRIWYVYFLSLLFGVAIAVVAIDPVVITPLTARVKAMPVAAAAPVEIVDVAGRTRTLTERSAGLGPFTRILLGNVLVAVVTRPELHYALEHENAHVTHHDTIKEALIATTLLVFAVALAVLLSDRLGFRRDDDAVSRLALVSAFLGAVLLLFLPLYNGYARSLEFRADEDSRRQIADPSAAVRLLVRRADRDLVPLCNRRSTGWYFADAPALGTLIAEVRHTQDPCPRGSF